MMKTDPYSLKIPVAVAAPIICAAFRAKWDLIKTYRRFHTTSPGHLVAHWCVKHGGYSLSATGRRLDRDHTCIRNSVFLVERRLAADPRLAATYARVVAVLAERAPKPATQGDVFCQICTRGIHSVMPTTA